MKSHDEDTWLLDEEAQLRVYNQIFKPLDKCICTSIGRYKGVQKLEIKLSYIGV